MTRDRNKTSLTHQVTDSVTSWLKDRGFKPVETEVAVGDHWIADVMAVTCPSATELTRLRLVSRAPTWRRPAYIHRAWHLQVMSMFRLMSCLVEVKTSVADFRHDRKWKIVPPTDLAYVAMPRKMIPAEQWPEGWGVLEYNQQRNQMRCVRPPQVRKTADVQQLRLVCNLMMRQYNVVTYKQEREFSKKWRQESVTSENIHRIDKVVKLVRDIVQGHYETVPEAAAAHGVKLQPHSIELLESIVR